MDMRFWNVEPFIVSARVFWSDSAELTGEDGSIHPLPVPADPGVEKTFREVEVDRTALLLLMMEGENEEASWARRKPLRARAGSFMVN